MGSASASASGLGLGFANPNPTPNQMFAIPAVFPLGILGGAIFPFWLSLFLTASGEALGNSLCYLMSASCPV